MLACMPRNEASPRAVERSTRVPGTSAPDSIRTATVYSSGSPAKDSPSMPARNGCTAASPRDAVPFTSARPEKCDRSLAVSFSSDSNGAILPVERSSAAGRTVSFRKSSSSAGKSHSSQRTSTRWAGPIVNAPRTVPGPFTRTNWYQNSRTS